MRVGQSFLRWGSSVAKKALNFSFLIITFSLFLVACKQLPTAPANISPIQTSNSQIGIATTSTASPTSTTPPVPTLSPTPEPVMVWLPPYLPEKLRSAITLPDGYSLADNDQQADISLQVGKGNPYAASQWVYALVAPFPTLADDVSSETIQAAWKGEFTPPFTSPILMDQSTFDVLSRLWGEPSPQAVQVLPNTDIVDQAWSNQPAWAIVPFEVLQPRWKVLSIDGQSPVRKDFDPAAYLLNIPFSLTGDSNPTAETFTIPATNRYADKLATVVMTGVTALVRATAYTMELKGVDYPAGDIGSLIADADITHISNEIPFSPDCPYPSSTMSSLVFCSNPKYIDLLKDVGTDVIELTGDHFMDYGADSTLYTLQMYKDLNWPYYGGGSNAEEARQPVLFEKNGNKIAFMGCNVGCDVKTAIPCTAIATDEHPGAAQCDFDWIDSEIPQLRQDGYQVIFTFQHIEYYTYTIETKLQTDFERVAAAGASIVSGSQAHQAHGFGFENDTFLHYGLGNLFFDQYHFCGYYACDDAFIDRHVFYDGQYISTELITIHFIDWARPRLMTPDERVNFLQIIFNASGW